MWMWTKLAWSRAMFRDGERERWKGGRGKKEKVKRQRGRSDGGGKGGGKDVIQDVLCDHHGFTSCPCGKSPTHPALWKILHTHTIFFIPTTPNICTLIQKSDL